MRSISYFGKLPGFGDFIQEKMPSRLSRRWEPWLEKSMSVSRQSLSDDWMDYYLNGPVWRFLLGPGLVDQHYYAGLLVPSMDQVGRYFPFSVFLPVAVEEIVDFSLYHAAWFNTLESVLLNQLELDQATKESLVGALYGTMHVLDQPANHRVKPESGMILTAESASELSSGYLSMLMTNIPNRSLWWTEGGQKVAPAALLTQAWPCGQTYTSLLDGRWDRLNEEFETVQAKEVVF